MMSRSPEDTTINQNVPLFDNRKDNYDLLRRVVLVVQGFAMHQLQQSVLLIVINIHSYLPCSQMIAVFCIFIIRLILDLFLCQTMRSLSGCLWGLTSSVDCNRSTVSLNLN